jgi:hypothetical protein
MRLGRCTVRDEEMVAPDGDSSRLAFRSSWTTALRALRHAVELNPGYVPAYQPLFFILFAETRDGCWHATGMCSHVASIVRDGDSVITTTNWSAQRRSAMTRLGGLCFGTASKPWSRPTAAPRRGACSTRRSAILGAIRIDSGASPWTASTPSWDGLGHP